MCERLNELWSICDKTEIPDPSASELTRIASRLTTSVVLDENTPLREWRGRRPSRKLIPVQLASSFHGGLLGAGLLLLRLGIGTTAIFEGFAYVVGHDGLSSLTWGLALLAIVAGISLTVGFLTPVASSVICLDALIPELFGAQVTTPSLFGARLSTVLIVVMTTAITLAGPGGLSIDARLFGLRRIRIPRRTEPRG